MTDADAADLQAQIVALRLSLESAWLSLLTPAADPVGDAQRLGAEHLAAIQRMDAATPAAETVRRALSHHTEQIWGSIAWQLANPAPRSETE